MTDLRWLIVLVSHVSAWMLGVLHWVCRRLFPALVLVYL